MAVGWRGEGAIVLGSSWMTKGVQRMWMCSVARFEARRVTECGKASRVTECAACSNVRAKLRSLTPYPLNTERIQKRGRRA